MAVRRVGPDGKVEVVVPPTPEEQAAEFAAILRIVEALARVAEERDFNERQRQRQRREAASASEDGSP